MLRVLMGPLPIAAAEEALVVKYRHDCEVGNIRTKHRQVVDLVIVVLDGLVWCNQLCAFVHIDYISAEIYTIDWLEMLYITFSGSHTSWHEK